MNGWNGEGAPRSLEERDRDAADDYESMPLAEVEARLRKAGINSARTIDAVAKIVREKQQEWSAEESGPSEDSIP